MLAKTAGQKQNKRNVLFFSVDGIRKQLDDNSLQREQYEKSQLNIAEELRSVRNRLDGESANLSSLTSEVRQRTRKLEDDHRLMVRRDDFQCYFE